MRSLTPLAIATSALLFTSEVFAQATGTGGTTTAPGTGGTATGAGTADPAGIASYWWILLVILVVAVVVWMMRGRGRTGV